MTAYRRSIPARELVPGDIVLLEAGNYVPADMRLVESVNLKIEEASLTGESVPVNKDARVVLDAEIPLGDRKNSAFMSTLVTYGRGRGLVTSTGMHTQIGMIAEMIQSYEEEPTPLQQKLDQLGKSLGIVALAICGLIFVFGLVRDTSLAMIFEEGLRAYLAAIQRRHRRALHDGGQPGDCRRARGSAGRRDHLPGAGDAAHGRPSRADPQAAGGRDAWAAPR